jgi:lysozyme
LTVYRCPAGIWTIGYGHTQGVRPDESITEAQAEQLLRADLAPVCRAIAADVQVSLTQGQFDALCSFIFNVGAGNFSHSTLLAKLNAKDYAGAADEFLRWNHVGDRVLPGLTARREAERQMFLND